MLPNFEVIVLASVISFFSNWQFGYQAHKVQNHCHECSLSYQSWTERWSLCVSSIYPGTFLGFILVPLMSPRVSLKSLLTLSCLPAIVGCIIQVFSRFFAGFGELPYYSSLIAGRFLIGVHSGISLCLLPIYFIETSIQSQRPFLSSLQQVFQAFSTLIGLICGSDILFSFGQYKIEYLQLIGLLPTLIFFFLLLKMPDTPQEILTKYMLLDEKSVELFEKSSKFYMGRYADYEEFKLEIYERWNSNSKAKHCELCNRINLKGLIIGSIAAISFAFTGDDIIDSFSSQIIFRHTEGTSLDAEGITIFLGVVLVIASIIGSFLMDKFGNRKLLISGLIGTSISNLIASIGSIFESSLVVTVGFSLTKAFIGLGAGSPAWFLTSELVSANITSTCQAISTGLLLLFVGLLTSVYLPLEMNLNELATILLTSLPAIFCAVFMILFLPETKDRRLDRIRGHLGHNLFSGLASLLKDPLSRRSTAVDFPKTTIHSYGSMGTVRIPSLSLNSADSRRSSMKQYNKDVF